jgi:hypothetical protein
MEIDEMFGPCIVYSKCNSSKKEEAPITGFAVCALDEYMHEAFFPMLPSFVELLDLKFSILPNVRSTLFANLSDLNLVAIDMSDIALETIEKGLFGWLKNVSCLSVSKNRYLTEESVEETLTAPGLRWLDASSSNLWIDRITELVGKAPDIHTLVLSKNILNNYDKLWSYWIPKKLKKKDYSRQWNPRFWGLG